MLKSLIFIEIIVAIGSAIFYYALNKQVRRELGLLPGIVFASQAAVAFLSPSLLITNIAVGLIPIVLGRTKLKVGMIVATGIFALPSLATPIVVAGAFLFPWTLQSSLSVGGLIAFLLAPGKAASARPETDLAIFVLIMILVVIDVPEHVFIGYLRQSAFYVIVYAIPVYIVTRSARNAMERRTLLTALAGAGVILAAIVIYELRGSWPLYASLSQHYGFEGRGLIVKWRGGLMRAYGPLGEATSMGFVLVICFAAAFSVRRAFKSNLAYVSIVAFIALAVFAPQSRGGIIGMAVAFVIGSFYRRGINGMGQILAAATLLSGAYIGSTVVGSVGNQINTSLKEAGTGDYRTELLRRGMQEFWKNPVFGDTYTNVVNRMPDMVQGEGIVDFVNTYLYFALLVGGIGLLMFCFAFSVPILRLMMMRAKFPPLSAERDVAGFCFALLCSAAVMLTFTSFLQRPSVYLLIASSMAMMIEIPRRGARKSEPELAVSRQQGPQAA